MHRNLRAIFLSLFVLSLTAFGQQTAAADAPPSKEEIFKFLELMQVKARMGQMFDGMKEQARLGAEQSFKEKIPAATPDQLKKVDAVADEMFSGFPIDELLDAMVPIYQKHLTSTDLEAIIGFYSSPVGQKFVREAPAMMSEGMQAGGEIGRKRMGEMGQRIDAKIADMVKEEKNQQTQKDSQTK